jgi:germination protein M
MEALVRLSNESSNPDEAPLPKGVAVRSVRLKGDTVTVDFNSQFDDSRFWGGSEHSYLAVQAIVNSLTEVKGVSRVQLLVEGKAVETIVGHVELSGPLERDDTVIGKSPAKGGRS